MDHQVKIRGNRIELGEIENRLMQHRAMKEAVVIAQGDINNKYLCAYIVTDQVLTVTELREFIAIELPEYMIPAYFIQIEKLPLTPNGKVDRRALANPGKGLNRCISA
jgi:acyl-coenzyme A synthetase/AMP-(fatty) acid ligase